MSVEIVLLAVIAISGLALGVVMWQFYRQQIKSKQDKKSKGDEN